MPIVLWEQLGHTISNISCMDIISTCKFWLALVVYCWSKYFQHWFFERYIWAWIMQIEHVSTNTRICQRTNLPYSTPDSLGSCHIVERKSIMNAAIFQVQLVLLLSDHDCSSFLGACGIYIYIYIEVENRMMNIYRNRCRGVYITFWAFRGESKEQKVYVNAIQNKAPCHEKSRCCLYGLKWEMSRYISQQQQTEKEKQMTRIHNQINPQQRLYRMLSPGYS